MIDIQEELVSAIVVQDIQTVKKYLLAGADPSQALDSDNVTPLHFAVQQCNIIIVKLLLEAGANYKAKTTDGQTPWDVAVLHGHLPIVSLLKEYLCQIN